MELKDQVCTLELAKALKAVGYKQNSFFYWSYFNDIKYPSWEICKTINTIHQGQYAAYTFSELAAMLPLKIENNGFTYYVSLSILSSGYFIQYLEKDSQMHLTVYHHKNLIESIGNILINLVTEGFIKP